MLKLESIVDFRLYKFTLFVFILNLMNYQPVFGQKNGLIISLGLHQNISNNYKGYVKNVNPYYEFDNPVFYPLAVPTAVPWYKNIFSFFDPSFNIGYERYFRKDKIQLLSSFNQGVGASSVIYFRGVGYDSTLQKYIGTNSGLVTFNRSISIIKFYGKYSYPIISRNKYDININSGFSLITVPHAKKIKLDTQTEMFALENNESGEINFAFHHLNSRKIGITVVLGLELLLKNKEQKELFTINLNVEKGFIKLVSVVSEIDIHPNKAHYLEITQGKGSNINLMISKSLRFNSKMKKL